MKNDISLEGLQQSTGRFFGRFHFMIFFILVAAGLVVAIYFLNGAIASSDPANSPITASSGFDTLTITRLEQLKEPGSTTKDIQTSGRINPF